MSSPANDEPDGPAGRAYNVGASARFNLPALDQASKQISTLNTQLSTLTTSLKNLSTQSSTLGTNISAMLKKIEDASKSLNTTLGQAPAAQAQAQAGTASGGGGLGSSLAASAFAAGASGLKSLALFPMRFLTSEMNTNRDLTMQTQGILGSQSWATSTAPAQMLRALAGMPGNVLGSPQDLLSVFGISRQVGAMTSMGQFGGTAAGPGGGAALPNAPRAAGFLKAISQAQQMNPFATGAELATTIGGFAANTGAQQQSMMLTGGAFGMIKRGGGMKSIQEWAEGILRWLEGLRPGAQRGKGFGYAELMSQYFPGSNIDAWLTANGVPPDMKEYFWTYALGKTAQTGGDTASTNFQIKAQQESLAYQKLLTSTSASRASFGLGAEMSGAYANKEQANRWFQDLLGQMMRTIIPSAISSGPLQFLQYLPDAIQELFMTFAEKNAAGTVAAGALGWGGLFSGMSDLDMEGDVGDPGGFSSLGGTTTAGLHPDMRRKVNSMMKANPRLKVNSGLRDLGTQRRLKRQGVGRVSGKPSAHTRGMAADLGPSSEYPWIVANAGKFGLKSGIGAGEPWHVGLGDPIEDIKSVFSGLFGFATGGLVGGGRHEMVSGIAESVSSILSLVLGGMTTKEDVPGGRSFWDVYSALVQGTNESFARGLKPPQSGGGGGGGGAPAGGGTAGSLREFYSQVLRNLGAPVTDVNLAKLGAIAKFEGNDSAFNPFNSKGGDFPNKVNSQGVENYPDWATGIEWTTKLLNQNNTSRMKANLLSGGSFADWRAATNAFYTWMPEGMPSYANQAAGMEMLTHQVGAGDADYAASMLMGGGSKTNMIFQNSFTIGGGGNTGMDVRRTVSLIADHLEDEMRMRMARQN